MKVAITLFLVLLTSCTASSQKRTQRKVVKDTLVFNFDKNYFKMDKYSSKSYVAIENINFSERIEYSFGKRISSMKHKKTLDFKEFCENIDRFNGGKNISSKQGKLLERLNDNVIVFVDKSFPEPRYFEVAIFHVIID